MTELIETENSVYEVDHANSRIRRLAGRNPSTRLTPEDGEWRHYARLEFPTFGDEGHQRMIVSWGTTMTSPILARKTVED